MGPSDGSILKTCPFLWLVFHRHGDGGLRHLQLISVHLCPEFHASLRTSTAQKKRAPRLVPGAQHWSSGQELRCFVVIFSIKIDPNKNKHNTFPWFPTFSHTFSSWKKTRRSTWLGISISHFTRCAGFSTTRVSEICPVGTLVETCWGLTEDFFGIGVSKHSHLEKLPGFFGMNIGFHGKCPR